MKINGPLRTGVVALAAWTTFGLAQTILAALMGDSHFNGEYMSRSLMQFMPRVIAWALFTPVIGFADSYVRRRSSSGLARLAFHVPLFIVCALLQAGIRRATLVYLDLPVTVSFFVTFFYFLDIEAVRYIASLLIARVLEAANDLAKRERRTQQLKDELAQAQIHYLDLQLQPHFLFNALGSIAELAHEAPHAAAKMVDHLVSLLRYATERRTRQEVTLKEELDALHPYLEIQRTRFPDWLDIEERIDPRAYDAMVPRMLLQPVVENAIRHGLSNRMLGGLIEVAASVTDDELVISVSDNGVGLDPAASSRGLGIGLANIRERLATLYGEKQSIDLKSHASGGVEAILRIPFRKSATVQMDATDIDSSATDEFPIPAEEMGAAAIMNRLTYAWIVSGIAMAILSIAYTAVRHPTDHEPFAEILIRHAIVDGLWILLTPAVIYLGRRISFTRSNPAVSIPLHLLIGSAIAIGHVQCTIILTQWIAGSEQPKLLSGLFMDLIFWNLTAYGALIAMSQRMKIETWIRERDVAAARMKAELTTARLNSAVLELKPEFLLSSLAALRALVLEDAAKAEKLLTSLADFLRNTLEARAVPASAMRTLTEQINQTPVEVHA